MVNSLVMGQLSMQRSWSTGKQWSFRIKKNHSNRPGIERPARESLLGCGALWRKHGRWLPKQRSKRRDLLSGDLRCGKQWNTQPLALWALTTCILGRPMCGLGAPSFVLLFHFRFLFFASRIVQEYQIRFFFQDFKKIHEFEKCFQFQKLFGISKNVTDLERMFRISKIINEFENLIQNQEMFMNTTKMFTNTKNVWKIKNNNEYKNCSKFKKCSWIHKKFVN